MEIKLEATTAHILFEEILSDHKNVDIKKVFKHLDLADWYAEVMLNGGKNQEGRFIALDNMEMSNTNTIKEVWEDIDEFKEIAILRLEKRGVLSFDSVFVQAYDDKFDEFIDKSLRIVSGNFTSPAKIASSQIATRHSIPEADRRKVRILLAEDNLVNQKIALRLLEKKLGYLTDVANNGKEAIKALESRDYDLVLMDCQMPEMDGYETTQTIRDTESSVKNHSITIVAMTANAMEGDRERCLAAGMDDYITKPVKLQKLSEIIERHLRKDIDKDSAIF